MPGAGVEPACTGEHLPVRRRGLGISPLRRSPCGVSAPRVTVHADRANPPPCVSAAGGEEERESVAHGGRRAVVGTGRPLCGTSDDRDWTRRVEGVNRTAARIRPATFPPLASVGKVFQNGMSSSLTVASLLAEMGCTLVLIVPASGANPVICARTPPSRLSGLCSIFTSRLQPM